MLFRSPTQGSNNTNIATAAYADTIGAGIMGANMIINGAMQIDQRNSGSSVVLAATGYVIDRWKLSISQASKITAGKNYGSLSAPPVGVSGNYLGFKVTTAYTIGASDYFIIGQNIEGNFAATARFGTANASAVALSFYVYCSSTGTFAGYVYNSALNRSYTFTYTISSANTWEKKTITIPGDTSGTWLTTTGIGISCSFGLGVGSTSSGTAGSWQAGNLFSVNWL